MNRARLFVVSAPSGCGKGTLLAKAFEKRPVYYSVSYTTRKKRPGEKEGVNYFYVDRRTFEKMISEKDFLEYARFNDHYYGTPKLPVLEHLARGIDVILEIETVGGFKVKKAFPDAVLLFILPPHVNELRRRLEKRGTEEPDVIEKRVKHAGKEIRDSYHYDYVIMNDDLDDAVRDLLTVVDSVRNDDHVADRFSTECDDTVKLIEKVILDA